MRDDSLSIRALAEPLGPIEMAERKGTGHPDTLCDALAENLSRGLCTYYREHFGVVHHHNVDKALLCAGMSTPRFGGGDLTEPIQIILAGRATGQVAGKSVPVQEIAIESSRQWLREHMPSLDLHRHVSIESRIHSGSVELTNLFGERAGAVPLANDTSFGVGYAPLSTLEALTRALDIERELRPEWGRDTKIMGVRCGQDYHFTVACAIVDAHVADARHYADAVDSLQAHLSDICATRGVSDAHVQVNTADDPSQGRFFLTVTGTSAEAGDDGQVGRGNRTNGLITPYRLMSLEAAAGKNPVNHVGKLYNLIATRIAAALVSHCSDVLAANCVLVSQIGRPITEPLLVDVGVQMPGELDESDARDSIGEIVADNLAQLPGLISEFISGELDVY